MDAQQFSENLAAVKIGLNYGAAKYGYIDTNGELVIESQFHKARDFRDGFASVSLGSSGFDSSHMYYENTKWGVINRLGEYEIHPQFESIWHVRDGIFQIYLKDNSGKQSGIMIDKFGNTVQPNFLNEYHGLAREYYQGFIDGIALAYTAGGLAGYINKAGDWVIGPRFKEAHGGFSEGLAGAKLPGESSKYGYIDKSGSWVIPPKFNSAGQFSDGLADVSIDERGQERTGYIDRGGDFVIPPQFEFGGCFQRGLAECRPIGGKTGFIDKTGKFIIKPMFERVGFPGNGLVPVCVGEHSSSRWGYIFL